MQSPYIQKIESGKQDEAIIFLNGYQTKDINNKDVWSSSLRMAGWEGSIYQLWWDSGSEYGRKYTVSPLRPLPAENIIHSYSHWKRILQRAKVSGQKYFFQLLSSISESQISLIGYSLGCRVIHYGMPSLSSESHGTSIKNIFLLAGAIRTINWQETVTRTHGGLYNFYNRNDKVLKHYFSHFGLYHHKPCGLTSIKSDSKKIRNIDITMRIQTDEHSLSTYLSLLSRMRYLRK
jgi:Protein of unknown function (DUF726)